MNKLFHATCRLVFSTLFVGVAGAGSALASVQFASSGASVLESAGSVTLQVVRTGAADQAASARIIRTHGSSTPGVDYTGGETTLSWAAGDTSPRNVTIQVLSDDLPEGDETAHFALTDVLGDTRGTPDAYTLTIRNSNPQTADNPALSDQQKNVGETVDNLCPVNPPPGAALPPACTTLEGLTDDQQQQALDDVLPKHVAQQSNDVTLAQSGATRAVGARMQTVRAGGGSGFQGNVSLRSGGSYLPLGGLTSAVLSDDGVSLVPATGGSAGGELLDERWGVFASGQLTLADQDSTSDRIGYVSQAQQITLGADYRFGQDVFAGMAMSISKSSADLNANTGSQDGSVLILMGYASTYLTEAVYVDGYVSMGSASYDTERVVRLGDDRAVITSTSDGHPVGAGGSIGIDFNDGAWSWGGYGRIDVNKLSIDAYDEEGGQGLALSIEAQDTRTTEVTTGAQVSRTVPLSFGVLLPKATLEWVHDLDDGNHEVQSSFVDNPAAGTFTYQTGSQDQDYFNVGWSIAGTFTEGRSAFIRYEALVGRSDYIAEQFEIGGRISF